MTLPKTPIIGRNHKEGPVKSEAFGFEDTRIKAEDVKKEMERLSNTPKILFIGGTHPRHLYYANKIHKRYPLAGAVLENRGDLTPMSPNGLPLDLEHMRQHHFHKRAWAENNYYGRQMAGTGYAEEIVVSKERLSSEQVLNYIKSIDPDIALIFGCGMIKGELAQALPELTINLHLGLSPRYRGAATLFWPFYFLEPQWAGCTFHKIVDEPDAGDILHQCVPGLAKGDGIHDVAAKAVVKATEEMIKLLGVYKFAETWDDAEKRVYGTGWKFHPQTTTGKNFLARDFQPSHLRMIYETYNNDIVDQYLDGNLKQHKPKLVRQF